MVDDEGLDMVGYVGKRAARGVVVAGLLVGALIAGGLVPVTKAAPVDLVAEPISTRHDDADWVPYIGSFKMWCVQGNPGFAGCARHHNRPAVDIGMPVGTKVRAAGPGRVVAARNAGDGRGTYVTIRHPDGVQSRYYHLRSKSVRKGQRVARGKIIGRSGRSGTTSAPHLHYEEVGRNGRTKEPGVMFGHRGSRVVRYPTAWGKSDWRRVRYGSRIRNDRFPPFDDVNPGMRVYQPVLWAANQGVVSSSARTFRKDAALTRAQAVSWIWRSQGRPAPTGEASYPDVPARAPYARALDWAAGVPGMLDPFVGEFGPGLGVQRVEFARLLWAVAGQPVVTPVRTHSDIDDPAVDWAVARRYLQGYGDGTFGAATTLTRGSAVRSVYRARPFKDVPLGSPIRGAVDWNRWRGYLAGFRDRTFRASSSLDRGTTIAMVWRSQGAPAASPAPFVDTGGQWYRAAADWAFEAGVSTGRSTPAGPEFRGARAQARGDWIRLLWRLHGSPQVDHEHPWSDVPTRLDAAADWASMHGIVNGFRDGTFRRSRDISRGLAVASLYRATLLPG